MVFVLVLCYTNLGEEAKASCTTQERMWAENVGMTIPVDPYPHQQVVLSFWMENV